MYILRGLLSQEEVKQILSNLADWKEGFTNSTKEHKDNFELEEEKLASLVAAKIQQHPLLATRLFIKRMTLPRFNKYEVGQKYAKHIDSFKQQGIQTDWSFTVMLEPPKKGGQLEINMDGRISKVDLEAGDIVVYPSGNIHQVLPVEEGTRIAAIGWIESLITSSEQRSILNSLVDTMQKLEGDNERKDLLLNLSFSYHNLLRMWSK